MKKKPPRKQAAPAGAWDDDAPVAPVVAKHRKPATIVDTPAERKRVARTTIKTKPVTHLASGKPLPPALAVKAKRVDKAIAQAIVEDLVGSKPSGDIIGTKPAFDKPVVIKQADVERGVYMDTNRNTAIVVSTQRNKVQMVRLVGVGNVGIEYAEESVDRFAHRYVITLPHYPIRRAARIYAESPQPKDEKSEALLRGLLRT